MEKKDRRAVIIIGIVSVPIITLLPTSCFADAIDNYFTDEGTRKNVFRVVYAFFLILIAVVYVKAVNEKED
ncbi:MAG: hypothetical protein MK212_16425 [Saprospiraceae bacterium]|nr:hypothetical protein [Saprospiraceae bacterium]